MITVVIVARNERLLPRTIESIRRAAPEAKILVLDDASDIPIRGAFLRHDVAQGCPTSRYEACQHVDTEMTFLMDGHMRVQPGDIQTVAEVAMLTGGIAYAGCNGHYAANLKHDCKILRAKWADKPAEDVVRTTAFMGAFYGIDTELLRTLGGWLALPGIWGCDEEAMSILAHKHGVPIHAVTSIQTWHDFRNKPPYPLPYQSYQLNLAAMHRLLFEDSTWAHWRKELADLWLDDHDGSMRHVPVPEAILRTVEQPEWVDYGQQIRARCKLTDSEFFETLQISI